ncbi:ornithine carbamoyltransferase [Trichodelitschia bisporula]|uniref:Ornithine carbamoyltransferase, mitochondrial n=1 Tax=Trichodelitschia bisporula TaxID=703511 RepID=A0A6G1IAX3_9PEZI|nr:ornithine carbamoyltransferase [Trichodelitschia bisporula]
MLSIHTRSCAKALTSLGAQVAPLRRPFSNAASSLPTSPFAPRHLLSIADLSPAELTTLVRNAALHKSAIKSGLVPRSLQGALAGKTVAMSFSKRSTRTRISTEGAVVAMGGHPMFLGKDDIQLGVNESLYDTSVVISSMTAGIVARVGPHSDVADLAKHSSVPVINALSDLYHPLQTVADFLTVHEAFPAAPRPGSSSSTATPGLGLEGLKLAWVGDANNVLFDLAIGAAKLGVDLAVATPKGYEIPAEMRDIIKSAAASAPQPGLLTETTVPEEAVKNADILVTDTWISMGQEDERVKRLKAFEGFQITSDLARRGGAKEGWKFMHCLPRHQEEVSDEVFYNPSRSLVFREAENRLWAAISVLEAFIVNKGKIPPPPAAPLSLFADVGKATHGDDGEDACADLADAVAEVEQADGEAAEDDGEVEPREEGALIGKEDFGLDALAEKWDKIALKRILD